MFIPINIAWRRTLERFYKALESIILGIIFLGLFAPISMFYRLMGSDPLNLKLQRAQKSYWIERNQVGLIPKSFYSQFIKK